MPKDLPKYTKDIKGDLHTHSSHQYCDAHSSGEIVDWDDACGRYAIDELAGLAEKRHMEYIAISNHATNPHSPTQPTIEVDQRLIKQQEYIEKLNAEERLGKIYVLSGVEASILPDGSLDVSNEVLERLDIVIASQHGMIQRKDYRQIKNGFLSAIINPFTDIIGHATRYISFLSVDDWHDIFDKAQEMDTAIELNTNAPPPGEIMNLMIEHGLKITLGSDTHCEENGAGLEEKLIGPEKFEQAQLLQNLYEEGVRKENIVNTYPLSQLLEWLRRKGV